MVARATPADVDTAMSIAEMTELHVVIFKIVPRGTGG
jgi:hypothetical protein